jgi:hypothetical protein
MILGQILGRFNASFWAIPRAISDFPDSKPPGTARSEQNAYPLLFLPIARA